MTDDTRDLVIELRTDVASLKEIVASLRATVELLDKQRTADLAQRSQLVWLGGAVIAAAGGVGAIAAKLAGWVTITVPR